MKEIIAFLSFYLFAIWSFSQPPCLPSPHGIIGTDEPPGCEICEPFYSGNTGGFTSDSLDFDYPCRDSIVGNQWFTVIADSVGTVSSSTLVSDCRPLGGGIFAVYYDFNLNPVSGCFADCGGIGLPGNHFVQGLIPGEKYLLMIDRCVAGNDCDFLLVFNTKGQKEVDLDDPEPILSSPDRNIFCSPNQACFSIPSVRGATDYAWSIPNQATIFDGGGFADTFVCVTFQDAVDGEILVRPFVNCVGGQSASFPVFVESKSSNISAIICPGETFEAGSEVFDNAGTFSITVENVSPFDCDSTIHLEIKIPDTSAVSIECVRDTFIQTIGINWSEKLLADNYEIYINDSLFSIQSFTSFLYRPNFSNEAINIEIKPLGTHGCEYASAKTTCIGPILTSAVDVFETESISVFPNPSNGVFEVFFRENSYGAKEKIERIEVFDFSGKEVKKVFDEQIDLSKLESGIYFLKIYFEEKVVLRKVMKL